MEDSDLGESSGRHRFGPYPDATDEGRKKLLSKMEKALVLKKRMYGAEDIQVKDACKSVVQTCNAFAMDFLARGDRVNCLLMLQRAESWTDKDIFMRYDAMRALTLNNFACYYKREGKLKTALKYLKEAAAIGTESMEVDNLSVTYLNLCAVLSQSGKHKQALENAQSAVFHCQEELLAAESKPEFTAKAKAEKMVTMGIAYHNLAVELEFTGRLDMCLQWYKKAVSLASKYGKGNAALLDMFKKSYQAAKAEIRRRRVKELTPVLPHPKSSPRKASTGRSAYKSSIGGVGPKQARRRPASARVRRTPPVPDQTAIESRIEELENLLARQGVEDSRHQSALPTVEGAMGNDTDDSGSGGQHPHQELVRVYNGRRGSEGAPESARGDGEQQPRGAQSAWRGSSDSDRDRQEYFWRKPGTGNSRLRSSRPSSAQPRRAANPARHSGYEQEPPTHSRLSAGRRPASASRAAQSLTSRSGVSEGSRSSTGTSRHSHTAPVPDQLLSAIDDDSDGFVIDDDDDDDGAAELGEGAPRLKPPPRMRHGRVVPDAHRMRPASASRPPPVPTRSPRSSSRRAGGRSSRASGGGARGGSPSRQRRGKSSGRRPASAGPHRRFSPPPAHRRSSTDNRGSHPPPPPGTGSPSRRSRRSTSRGKGKGSGTRAERYARIQRERRRRQPSSTRSAAEPGTGAMWAHDEVSDISTRSSPRNRYPEHGYSDEAGYAPDDGELDRAAANIQRVVRGRQGRVRADIVRVQRRERERELQHRRRQWRRQQAADEAATRVQAVYRGHASRQRLQRMRRRGSGGSRQGLHARIEAPMRSLYSTPSTGRRRRQMRKSRSGGRLSRSSSDQSVTAGLDSFLRDAGLAKYRQQFLEQAMDMQALRAAAEELPALDDDLLLALGLQRVGDRLKFKRALTRLLAGERAEQPQAVAVAVPASPAPPPPTLSSPQHTPTAPARPRTPTSQGRVMAPPSGGRSPTQRRRRRRRSNKPSSVDTGSPKPRRRSKTRQQAKVVASVAGTPKSPARQQQQQQQQQPPPSQEPDPEQAATALQAVYRGHATRKVINEAKERDEAAVRVQRGVRGRIARNEAFRRRALREQAERDAAAARLQAVYKGHSVRSRGLPARPKTKGGRVVAPDEGAARMQEGELHQEGSATVAVLSDAEEGQGQGQGQSEVMPAPPAEAPASQSAAPADPSHHAAVKVQSLYRGYSTRGMLRGDYAAGPPPPMQLCSFERVMAGSMWTVAATGDPWDGVELQATHNVSLRRTDKLLVSVAQILDVLAMRNAPDTMEELRSAVLKLAPQVTVVTDVAGPSLRILPKRTPQQQQHQHQQPQAPPRRNSVSTVSSAAIKEAMQGEALGDVRRRLAQIACCVSGRMCVVTMLEGIRRGSITSASARASSPRASTRGVVLVLHDVMLGEQKCTMVTPRLLAEVLGPAKALRLVGTSEPELLLHGLQQLLPHLSLEVQDGVEPAVAIFPDDHRLVLKAPAKAAPAPLVQKLPAVAEEDRHEAAPAPLVQKRPAVAGEDRPEAASPVRTPRASKLAVPSTQDDHAAAAAIQAAARGRRARERLRKKHAAAARIQAAKRGAQARREVAAKREAAVKIQAVGRGHIARERAFQEALHKEEADAARKIQNSYRGVKATREAHLEVAKRRMDAEKQQAAVSVQATVRGHQGRKRAQATMLKRFMVEQKRHLAAAIIQSAFFRMMYPESDGEDDALLDDEHLADSDDDGFMQYGHESPRFSAGYSDSHVVFRDGDNIRR